jgi:hypothetical protein
MNAFGFEIMAASIDVKRDDSSRKETETRALVRRFRVRRDRG